MDKRQKKISKVMGEFKDGTLKSGGSGKKVTNPKQAMAIALAQANKLNQGGMLGDIYSRPMFPSHDRPQVHGTVIANDGAS